MPAQACLPLFDCETINPIVSSSFVFQCNPFIQCDPFIPLTVYLLPPLILGVSEMFAGILVSAVKKIAYVRVYSNDGSVAESLTFLSIKIIYVLLCNRLLLAFRKFLSR